MNHLWNWRSHRIAPLDPGRSALQQARLTILVTVLSLQLGTSGCNLAAEEEATHDQSQQIHTARAVLETKLQERIWNIIPEIREGWDSFLEGLVETKENIDWLRNAPGDASFKWATFGCFDSVVSNCRLDESDPSFTFANGLCDVDPKIFCAADSSVMTNLLANEPGFENWLAQVLNGGAERTEELQTNPVGVGVTAPPGGGGISGGQVLALLLGSALVAVAYFALSSRRVTHTSFAPNIVATNPTLLDIAKADASLDLLNATTRPKVTHKDGTIVIEWPDGDEWEIDIRNPEHRAAFVEMIRRIYLYLQAVLRHCNAVGEQDARCAGLNQANTREMSTPFYEEIIEPLAKMMQELYFVLMDLSTSWDKESACDLANALLAMLIEIGYTPAPPEWDRPFFDDTANNQVHEYMRDRLLHYLNMGGIHSQLHAACN